MSGDKPRSRNKTEQQLQLAAAHLGQAVLLVRRVAYSDSDLRRSRGLMDLSQRWSRGLVTLERYIRNFNDTSALRHDRGEKGGEVVT